MHSLLLGLATGAFVATPAPSVNSLGASFSASAALNRSAEYHVSRVGHVMVHRLAGVPAAYAPRHQDARGGYADTYAPGFFYPGSDVNRSWDPDSFNDWWHDRPDRAYPRWVWHNRNCSDDRAWWSGAGWRCTP